MPITINGSGTITGISVGGLPDGVVTVSDISATGTPSSTTYLRGDGTWSTVSGGVTSAVAGNGVAVSGSTGAVTFSVAAPSYGSVGSYVYGRITSIGALTVTAGNNYSAGSGNLQVTSTVAFSAGGTYTNVNNLSGTWKYMGCTFTPSACFENFAAVFVRVS
jgi:hypothetical protein